MSHLNQKGPGNIGAKTGRKLGICTKSEEEKNNMGTPGIGRGYRKNSPTGKAGKGRRLQYNKNV